MSRVSIIVPIYNVSPYLEQCLTSILEQDYEDMQIILVDDGSTDGSGDIADRFSAKDGRIQVLHKENGGLVSARKAGLKLADGQYIMCVDGDDSLMKGYISEMMFVAQRDSADVVTSAADWGLRKQYDALPCGLYQSNEEREFLYKNMLSTKPFYTMGILPYLWGKVFKKKVIYNAQMHVDDRISVGEDVACTYAAILNAERITVTSICKYQYRQREDSMIVKDINISDESIEHLAHRYAFMKKEFMGMQDGILIRQLKEYAYFTLFFKYPELLMSDDGEEFLPFGIKKGERIVLYGNGQYGRKLEKILTERDFCKIIYKTDRNVEKSKEIRPLTTLLNTDFDRIVLATMRSDYLEEMQVMIERMGIQKEKVCGMHSSEALCQRADSILMTIAG